MKNNGTTPSSLFSPCVFRFVFFSESTKIVVENTLWGEPSLPLVVPAGASGSTPCGREEPDSTGRCRASSSPQKYVHIFACTRQGECLCGFVFERSSPLVCANDLRARSTGHDPAPCQAYFTDAFLSLTAASSSPTTDCLGRAHTLSSFFSPLYDLRPSSWVAPSPYTL
ncbi:hypothetical protein TGRUB_431610 [Toxoplasma gondii RUB]|uniref:Uncharacterized protein n=1 Tax=Toxoplasma gondii RUB TaxID=935652 RepID=A0A086LWI8_TOXGO|nr:hypothetical protein TGRUB_431610 [Toxoplasma gondii RUB]